MKNTISIKKPTFVLSLILTFGIGILSGILLSAYISTKDLSAEKNDKIKGMENAILSKLNDNPENVELLVQLGHFYFDNSFHKKAITAYEKALAINANQPNVMTDLAIMYRRTKDKNKAIKILNDVMKKYPTHQPSRFNKGIILANDFEDSKGTVKVWKALLKINPKFTSPDGTPLEELIKHYKDGH